MFQEPDMATVLKAMAVIEARFGMDRPPIVRSIEISVDFTPKVSSEVERAKIARVLMNHLLVDLDVITNIRDRPRTVWGRDQSSVTRLIYDSKHLTAEGNKRFLIETERDRAPFTDGTLEIGAKEANVSWRVMDKIIDRQNVSAGTCVVLGEAEKRARIEVTLDRPEVEALGITLLSDLNRLNFTRLQGRYFRFFLPTFTGAAALGPGRKSALLIWQDRQRAIKFSKSGGLSLKAMDDALAEQKTEIKRQALRDLHRRGLRLPGADRTGRGLVGSFVAYEELNDCTRTALRNLGLRVVAGFDREA
jgi:ribosomal protein S24E